MTIAICIVCLLITFGALIAIRQRHLSSRKAAFTKLAINSFAETISSVENTDVAWVKDFNLKLGQDLGGILNVMQVFNDPDSLLKLVVGASDHANTMRRRGVPIPRIADMMMTGMRNRFSDEYCLAFCRCFRFFGESLQRLQDDATFREWVRTSKFSVMPDMFTHALLTVALKRVEDGDAQHESTT